MDDGAALRDRLAEELEECELEEEALILALLRVKERRKRVEGAFEPAEPPNVGFLAITNAGRDSVN